MYSRTAAARAFATASHCSNLTAAVRTAGRCAVRNRSEAEGVTGAAGWYRGYRLSGDLSCVGLFCIVFNCIMHQSATIYRAFERAVCFTNYMLPARPASGVCSRAVRCQQQPVARSCQQHIWVCPDTALPCMHCPDCTAGAAMALTASSSSSSQRRAARRPGRPGSASGSDAAWCGGAWTMQAPDRHDTRLCPTLAPSMLLLQTPRCTTNANSCQQRAHPAGVINKYWGGNCGHARSTCVCCVKHVGRPKCYSSAAYHAQVEVKLRLPGREAHQQLEQLFAPGRVATHQQVGAVGSAAHTCCHGSHHP